MSEISIKQQDKKNQLCTSWKNGVYKLKTITNENQQKPTKTNTLFCSEKMGDMRYSFIRCIS